MTVWLLEMLAAYGSLLLFLTTWASCLALPVPSSLLMLTAGAFVATADLTLSSVAGAAFLGAVTGDQTGFHLARRGKTQLDRRLKTHRKSAALFERARNLLDTWGGSGVFLSRWLFSPLGPYVNFAGGAMGLNWLRFSLWAALGEAVWVGMYVSLGYVFAGNIAMAADLAGNTLGLLAALVVLIGSGAWLRHNHQRNHAPDHKLDHDQNHRHDKG